MRTIVRIRCANSNIELTFDCTENKQLFTKFIYDNRDSTFYLVSFVVGDSELEYCFASEQPKIYSYGTNSAGNVSMIGFDRGLNDYEKLVLKELSHINVEAFSLAADDKIKLKGSTFTSHSCGEHDWCYGESSSEYSADCKPKKWVDGYTFRTFIKDNSYKENKENLESALEYLRYAKDNINMAEHFIENIKL